MPSDFKDGKKNRSFLQNKEQDFTLAIPLIIIGIMFPFSLVGLLCLIGGCYIATSSYAKHRNSSPDEREFSPINLFPQRGQSKEIESPSPTIPSEQAHKNKQANQEQKVSDTIASPPKPNTTSGPGLAPIIPKDKHEEKLFQLRGGPNNREINYISPKTLETMALIRPETVQNLLSDFNWNSVGEYSSNRKIQSANSFSVIAEMKPNCITEEAVKVLTANLKDENKGVSDSVAQSLVNISCTRPDLISKELRADLNKVQEVQGISPTINADFSSQILELSKRITPNGIEDAIAGFKVTDLNDKKYSIEYLGMAAALKPTLLSERDMDPITNALKDPELSGNSIEALYYLSFSKAELISSDTLSSLNDAFKSANKVDKENITHIYTNVASVNSDLISEKMIATLTDELKDQNSEVRKVANSALAYMCRKNITLITDEVLDGLADSLKDPNSEIRYPALSVFENAAFSMPSILTAQGVDEVYIKSLHNSPTYEPEKVLNKAIEIQTENLNNSKKEVREDSVRFFSTLSSHVPHYIPETILGSLIKISEDTTHHSEYIIESAGNIVQRILTTKEENINYAPLNAENLSQINNERIVLQEKGEFAAIKKEAMPKEKSNLFVTQVNARRNSKSSISSNDGIEL